MFLSILRMVDQKLYIKMMMQNFKHPLMENNILDEDVKMLQEFLINNKKKIFTQSEKVLEL